MRQAHSRHCLLVISVGVVLASLMGGGRARAGDKDALDDVLVYSTLEDGSIMHWLAVSPLRYNIAFLGDSMSADALAADGETELTVRPRASDKVQNEFWRKVHLSGSTVGATVGDLFTVAGRGFEYGITCCYVYVYSPRARPDAIFSGSADDALKVILNGKKIWSNQIQRSPTYDSDKAPAPLKAGWNQMLLVVDQVWGGHLVCARFLDGGTAVTDIEISLDPPAGGARRHPAGPYNREAAELVRSADALRLDGKLEEALVLYERTLTRFPLSDVAPRAVYGQAGIYYAEPGKKSLNRPEKAIEALERLLDDYGQDLLAEYALLDLSKIRKTALKDAAGAEASYRSFEKRYPRSSLAAKSLVELARLQTEQEGYDEALLTYRRAIKKYPMSDEVMTSTVGIADTYRKAGEREKALEQYAAASAMAKDWHDNKYGVDVGKQAWLFGLINEIRERSSGM